MSDSYHILYWRDIPSMLKGKVGRKRVSKPLSNRFMEAIDIAAMLTDDTDTDAYLEEWQPSEPIEFVGDPEECLEKTAAELEEKFPPDLLMKVAQNGGRLLD